MAQLFAHEVQPRATIDSERAGDSEGAGNTSAHAPLPLVALVLGAAGVVLGVTLVWFFAAIPVGIVSVALGVVARRHLDSYDDPRAASRATIGTALGCIAILLGVTGAIFLPRVMERADRFLETVQQDVNDDVGLVNGGLSRDVNRLDHTLTRDLRRFERQNRTDLTDLENRTAATLQELENRLNRDVTEAKGAARGDLVQLEAALRADLRAAQADARTADTALRDSLAALEARIVRIEHELGL